MRVEFDVTGHDVLLVPVAPRADAAGGVQAGPAGSQAGPIGSQAGPAASQAGSQAGPIDSQAGPLGSQADPAAGPAPEEAVSLAARLLEAGARVHVAVPPATTLPASLLDLIERGLVRAVEASEATAAIAASEATAARAGFTVILPVRPLTSDPGAPHDPAVGSADDPAVRPTDDPAVGSADDPSLRATDVPGSPTPVAGEVVLVGAGPGDPGLLTQAGLAELERADVVAYDRLAPLAALSRVRPGAELIDVGKIPRGLSTPQEEINDLLIDRARTGARVVRFKGGDIFVFGRGGEEIQAAAAAGVPTRIVPGVSSALAGPALAGIPVTHRGLVQGFTVISGHVPPSSSRSTLDYAALAASGTTLVVLMGARNLPAIATALIAGGLSADTPAATIADAALPSMRVVRAPLEGIAAASSAAGLGAPAITVIGAVAALDLSNGRP